MCFHLEIPVKFKVNYVFDFNIFNLLIAEKPHISETSC